MPTFNIGKQFSANPEGRFYTDGEGNGEDFRENHLLPKLSALTAGSKLTIVIDDDVDGYGSSFLTEGFAGIVKYGYMNSEELLSKIDIVYTNEEYKFFADRIVNYICGSKYNSETYVSTRP